MIEIRRSDERGSADHGWLKTLHSFSFADYYDPRNMGFGALRVINEDRVAPGTGFGTHGHRDMEILTYVLDGALAHRDSLGNGSVIRSGDVQRMSAGTGVQHSEYNHEKHGVTHFLQIWIEPSTRGIAPGYEQRHFDAASKRGRLRVIAAPDARDGALTIHQDAFVSAGLFDGDERAEFMVGDGRRLYAHLVRGRLQVNGQRLEAGDAAKFVDETAFVFDHGHDAEVLVFDLA
ncbi:MAG TPA: pirin family protein [Zeimonas sp.]